MLEFFDFFDDPTPEEQNVVLVDVSTLRKAEQLIASCEECNPEGAEIPFDNILDRVTHSDLRVTDYILESPAKCPNCRHDVLEKTPIERLRILRRRDTPFFRFLRPLVWD